MPQTQHEGWGVRFSVLDTGAVAVATATPLRLTLGPENRFANILFFNVLDVASQVAQRRRLAADEIRVDDLGEKAALLTLTTLECPRCL
jgi:hypothetical protein